jgi:hypothetical protein
MRPVNPTCWMNLYLDDDMTKASLVVRLRHADPRRDMTDGDIARALVNLEAANAPIANELHVLNHWR